MKEIFIKSLRKDMEVTDFFMVKSSAIRTGANGKQYLDITLGDKTGEVSAKKWDVSEAEQESLVQIKEKEIVNEKYEFRCFLLRLGLIGDEYKDVRKQLLKNLSGSAAFKCGHKKGGEE